MYDFERGFEVFTVDNLHHFLGGAALTLIVVSGLWNPSSLLYTVPILIAIQGLLREQAQAKSWLPHMWLKKHKIAEGLMWGVGSAFVMGTIYILSKIPIFLGYWN